MNQRIKELEKKCWDYQTNHLNAEKFAELIVRECVNINQQELSFNAFEQLMNRYNDHFGVEL